jgi:hypothetical protein
MRTTLNMLAGAAFMTSSSAGIAADYSTPTSALRSLEAAYVAKDINAAVDAKDFSAEAREMLLVVANGDTSISQDPRILQQTADVLEKGYRLEMRKKGFPDMSKLKCEITEQTPRRPDLVPMLEKCLWPDGSTSSETVYAVKVERGWKIINVPRGRS